MEIYLLLLCYNSIAKFSIFISYTATTSLFALCNAWIVSLCHICDGRRLLDCGQVSLMKSVSSTSFGLWLGGSSVFDEKCQLSLTILILLLKRSFKSLTIRRFLQIVSKLQGFESHCHDLKMRYRQELELRKKYHNELVELKGGVFAWIGTNIYTYKLQ